MSDDLRKLIIEIAGPEEKIQELLEKIEEMIEKDGELDIKAVTIRRD